MEFVFYFAYGSNMLAERLQRRCRSAVVHGVAVADDYALAFSKIGQDDSGKATLVAAAGVRTHGVVFRISIDDLALLDRFEGRGRGYERWDDFSVRCASDGGKLCKAATYIASTPYLDDKLRPFDWYLDLVIHGARQHGLPPAHIEAITRTQAVIDPDPGRQQRLEALEILDLVSASGGMLSGTGPDRRRGP
ncbi:MAG: gamma-glutamylcyclotransferase [Alphaproteobacteria bacterium]|nr:gamma-glutamylcyclotransferase [Alphaproteobacteria bacterium]